MGKSNLQKRKQLIFSVIALVVVIAGIVILVMVNKNKTTVESTTPAPTLENGLKENQSEKLKEEKKFEGLIIKDIQLKTENGETIFTAKVENTSDNDFKGAPTTITFIDKNGKELLQLGSYIDETLKGSSSAISTSANIDITDVYDFTIKYKVE